MPPLQAADSRFIHAQHFHQVGNSAPRRRSSRLREPKIDDAGPDGILTRSADVLPEWQLWLAAPVPSALAVVDENLIEFAKPVVERHGIDSSVRRPRRIICYWPTGAHPRLVLACASSGLDGLFAGWTECTLEVGCSDLSGALCYGPCPASHALFSSAS